MSNLSKHHEYCRSSLALSNSYSPFSIFDPSVLKNSSFQTFFCSVKYVETKNTSREKKKKKPPLSHSSDIVYRASNTVVVISFVERVPYLLDEESPSYESVKKPGCFGLGNKLSLLNI
jgi:hypothetical protein